MNIPESVNEQEVNVRQERAERILDAAAELYQRHGYKRVTIDDIAERAEIGKGTIYLHWKTRQALSIAVLEREFLNGLDELVGYIRADPQAALLHRMSYNLYVGVMHRPLLHALYTSDWETLGKLTKSGLGGKFQSNMSMASNGYLPLLVESGLIRPGLTANELVYTYRATIGGFFITDAFVNEQDSIAIERRAALLSEIVQRAFEAEPPPSAQVVQVLAPRVIAVWEKIGSEVRARLAQAYE
jgi:AcrR family transcriptional regulator